LTEIENKILDYRTSGLSFCQLEETDLRVATDKIIIRYSSMCGCPLPQTEYFAEVLSDEISIFINDFGYRNLTLDEILFAIRINAGTDMKLPPGIELQHIEFTGVCVNVNFISKVLRNYMAIRNMLDRRIQNKLDGYPE